MKEKILLKIEYIEEMIKNSKESLDELTDKNSYMAGLIEGELETYEEMKVRLLEIILDESF